MTALLRNTHARPGIESYSTTVLMQWCRLVVSDLRTVAIANEKGERVVAAKFSFKGEDVVVTESEERELALSLVRKVCELRGWRVPGAIPARDQAELDIVAAMTGGNADFARAMVREFVTRNEEARGYRGARSRPLRFDTSAGWRTSTKPGGA